MDYLKGQQALQRFVHEVNRFCFFTFRVPGSRRIARRISKLLLPRLDKKLRLTSTIHGIPFVVNTNGGTHLYQQGFYEEGTIQVIKKFLHKGDVFIDAGASLGYMSILAAHQVGSEGLVFCFEPQFERNAMLNQNIELNQLKNCKSFKCALGEKPNKLELNIGVHSPSFVHKGNNDQFETVDVKVLDDVLDEVGVSEVHMMKVDVEGFEMNVLAGATRLLTREMPPILILEYVRKHQVANESQPPLFDFLRSKMNYKVFQLKLGKDIPSRLVEITNEKNVTDYDNIFCFPKSRLDELTKA